MSHPNVLYVTVDSIRADHVGYAGYDRPTTPTIDGLAERGTACSRAIANGIPTYYSFKSLLGGIPSLGHSRDIGMPNDVTTLAEAFRDAGYETAGFSAGNPWLTREYGYDRGFETYRDFLTDGEDDSGGLGRALTSVTRRVQPLFDSSEFLKDKAGFAARTAFALLDHQPLEDAETLTEAALEWLETRQDDRPFFLWLHYMDPHYPWVPRDQDMRRFSDSTVSKLDIARLWHKVSHLNKAENGVGGVSSDELTRITDLYDAEVRRTDAALGRVLDALRTRGALDDTVVSVVGDHGTELQDHGGFSHGPRKLYDEIVRVPLVFAGPNVPDRSVTDLSSLLDVAPTLLDAAGVEDVPESFAGRSVFEGGRESAVTEVVYDFEPVSGDNQDNGLLRSCIDWPWKLIVNDHRGTRELYDLASDPGEQTDVSGANPDVVDDLVEILERNRADVERQNNTIRERAHVRSTVAELKHGGSI
jgi:arylsulfatase A-like enzyme